MAVKKPGAEGKKTGRRPAHPPAGVGKSPSTGGREGVISPAGPDRKKTKRTAPARPEPTTAWEKSQPADGREAAGPGRKNGDDQRCRLPWRPM